MHKQRAETHGKEFRKCQNNHEVRLRGVDESGVKESVAQSLRSQSMLS